MAPQRSRASKVTFFMVRSSYGILFEQSETTGSRCAPVSWRAAGVAGRTGPRRSPNRDEATRCPRLANPHQEVVAGERRILRAGGALRRPVQEGPVPSPEIGSRLVGGLEEPEQ